MDEIQNSSPAATPTPAHHGINWGVVLGAAIAAALIAGGVYYLYIAPHSPIPQPQTIVTQQQPTDSSVESLEADLNASGNAENGEDLNSLEQSL